LVISLYALARLFSYHTIDLPLEQKEDQTDEPKNASAKQENEQTTENEEQSVTEPDEPSSGDQASPTTTEEDISSHG
jgi:hypothetical protein